VALDVSRVVLGHKLNIGSHHYRHTVTAFLQYFLISNESRKSDGGSDKVAKEGYSDQEERVSLSF